MNKLDEMEMEQKVRARMEREKRENWKETLKALGAISGMLSGFLLFMTVIVVPDLTKSGFVGRGEVTGFEVALGVKVWMQMMAAGMFFGVLGGWLYLMGEGIDVAEPAEDGEGEVKSLAEKEREHLEALRESYASSYQAWADRHGLQDKYGLQQEEEKEQSGVELGRAELGREEVSEVGLWGRIGEKTVLAEDDDEYELARIREYEAKRAEAALGYDAAFRGGSMTRAKAVKAVPSFMPSFIPWAQMPNGVSMAEWDQFRAEVPIPIKIVEDRYHVWNGPYYEPVEHEEYSAVVGVAYRNWKEQQRRGLFAEVPESIIKQAESELSGGESYMARLKAEADRKIAPGVYVVAKDPADDRRAEIATAIIQHELSKPGALEGLERDIYEQVEKDFERLAEAEVKGTGFIRGFVANSVMEGEAHVRRVNLTALQQAYEEAWHGVTKPDVIGVINQQQAETFGIDVEKLEKEEEQE